MSVSWNGKTDEGQNNATEGRVQMEGWRDDMVETTNEGPEARWLQGGEVTCLHMEMKRERQEWREEEEWQLWVDSDKPVYWLSLVNWFNWDSSCHFCHNLPCFLLFFSSV